VFRSVLVIALLACTSCAHTEQRPTPKPETNGETLRLQQEYREIGLQNVCPDGVKRLQGKWKFVGETKTPKFSSLLAVDGTSYRETLEGEPDGKVLKTDVSGEIRCLFKNRILIMVDKVVPEGGFSNQSGDLYPCDVLDSMQKDQRILLICFFDWDLRPSKGLSFEYERVSN